MGKKKLLVALLVCTAVSVNTQGFAATHDVNVPEVINKTYDGYITQGDGGAITNSISSVIKESTFKNNRAENNGSGGAIDLNTTPDTLTQIINSNFEGNYSNWSGGAIVQRRNAGKLEISGGSYTNNITEYEGGAIFLGAEANVTSTIDKVVFEGNKTLSTNFNDRYTIADDGGGGAIFVGSASHAAISNSDFKNNVSNTVGGAIAVRNDSKNNGSNSLSVTNSNFTGNEAIKDGGAIASFIDITLADSTFEGNTSGRNGGAVSLDFKNPNSEGSKGSNFNNLQFSNNSAQVGGAIYNTGTLTVNGSTFTGNHSTGRGGAILTESGMNITNSSFDKNYSTAGDGGAIRIAVINDKANNVVNITGSSFTNNEALTKYADSGAISIGNGIVNIDSSEFIGNKADYAGAIYAYTGNVPSKPVAGAEYGVQVTINNSLFENNEASAIGAVGNFASTNVLPTGGMTIKNSVFRGNKATVANDDGAGALFLGAESKTNISNTVFENNYSASKGGAIATREGNVANNSGAVLDIADSTFTGNTADGNGGAIYNTFYNSKTEAGKVSIVNSTFSGNKSGENGGAIYNNGNTDKAGNSSEIALEDSSFINNTASGKGGAIYAGTDLSVTAKNKEVIFSGNKSSDGNDIFMGKENSKLSLNAAADKSITLASGVAGEKYNMVVNENSANTGSIIVNSSIQNAAIAVQNGTFHLSTGSALDNSTLNMASGTTLNTINNEVNNFGNNLTLADNVNLAVDVNLSNGKADNFANTTHSGNVTVTEVNPMGAAQTTSNNVNINIVQALGLDPSNVTLSDTLLNQTQTVLTPIRYLQGGVSADGMLTMAPTGSGYKDFNPAVMASPVAAQLGGYLTQLNSYDEAFRNMDMYMLMTKKQRQAMKLRNKYAAADGNIVFNPLMTQYENKAGWFRPYATFENVHLKGGPRVSNVSYGSFFGAESELYDLGHGWDGMWGAYVGYNGSHQAYNGIGIYQNGGTLGAVGMAYKGNFFTGLTVNAGANGGEASTMYGNDNFSMLMAGIASKTGYNIELADGKFIIQPNFLMSYSFVNTFDYTNAAGVSINSDPLHAIQIEPGVKFIGNLKNGWQPYIGVSMVWNIMDKTHFNANDVSLPELSVKPFVRYGIGVRKTWGERFTGFFQCYFMNGGRNGVGLQTGFRWSIGKAPASSIKKQSSAPQLKKTEIKLSNNK